MSIVRTPEGIAVSWAGGIAPFLLQRTNFMPPDQWVNVGRPTMARSKSFAVDLPQGYFRVEEAVKMLDIDLTRPDTFLVWSIPDLE